MTLRQIRIAFAALITVVLLAAAPGAFAASEQGDAGDLLETAQDLGSESVPWILGSFTDAEDADVYRLCLANGTTFSASTVGATTLDTQLFLFDSNGFGVYANDDWNGSRGSRLPSRHRFSPSSGGVYYLAISSYNRDPQSSEGEIFQDSFNPLAYPDGVLDANGFGAGEPLSSWAGRAPGGPGFYMISLTGTRLCDPQDTTPPTIDLRSPADGARVPQGAELIVDFSCSDQGGSGLASCVGSTENGQPLDTSRLGELSVTVTARDVAGNQTVVTHTVTVVDETTPQITVSAPVDGAVYGHREHVVADYACTDEPGGSGIASCSGTVAKGALVDTGSVGKKSFVVQAADVAGNTASKTVTYTVVDRTPPAITLSAPADGAVFKLGERVLAVYACDDGPGGSGVATCEGTVANGRPVDTSRVGTHFFEVRSADTAGNRSSKTVTYSVVWGFRGFFPPVQNPPNVNRWKAGLPVPIRFSLGGYQGAHPEAPGFPRSVRCGGGDAIPAARGASKKRPVFAYERRSDRYGMVWKTSKKWAGTCRDFVLQLDDGSVHTARFEFAKRPGRERGGRGDRERRGRGGRERGGRGDRDDD